MRSAHLRIMKSLPIGNADFQSIVEDDLYYVDKTELIERIVEDRGTKAFLFTRPRRFGKSTNLSMIDAFFNLEYRGNTWFDGLKVSSCTECDTHKNMYPVISISFKDMNVKSYDIFLEGVAKKIKEVCRGFTYLLGSPIDDVLQDTFELLRTGRSDETDLEASLKTLSDALRAYHDQRAIILIDEYDSPINRSEGDVKEEVLGFMRQFMSSVLKDNDSLKFGVVTGVFQIAKENIFSGLNNLYVNNVFSKDFNEMFGFTESEVKGILQYYGHPEKMDDIREWYDGYSFGGAEVYNPWSILSCVKRDLEIRPYWVWEGNPDIILDSLRANGIGSLTDLYNGDDVDVPIQERITYSQLDTPEGMYSVLVASGYLKARPVGDGIYRVSIANKEVRNGLIRQLIGGWSVMRLNDISAAILSGNTETIVSKLRESLDSSVDPKLLQDEFDYEIFALGLLDCLKDSHYVRSEVGAGRGYADIMITPRDGKGPSAVIELKRSKDKDGDGMQRLADDALYQIMDRRYFSALKGKVLLYGVAFQSTDVFISFREINR